MPWRKNSEFSSEERPSGKLWWPAAGVAACVIVAAVDAFIVEPRRLVLEKVDIPIWNLPEVFEGYRIAILADLHYPRWTRPEDIHRAIALANTFEPDLLAIPGDICDKVKGKSASMPNLSGLFDTARPGWNCRCPRKPRPLVSCGKPPSRTGEEHACKLDREHLHHHRAGGRAYCRWRRRRSVGRNCGARTYLCRRPAPCAPHLVVAQSRSGGMDAGGCPCGYTTLRTHAWWAGVSALWHRAQGSQSIREPVPRRTGTR